MSAPVPLFLPPLLLAAADPTWTDKELLVAIGSTVGLVVTAMLVVWRLLSGGLRSQLKAARDEINELKKVKVDVRPDPEQERLLTESAAQLRSAQEEVKRLRDLHHQTSQKSDEQTRMLEHLRLELAGAQLSIQQHIANTEQQQREMGSQERRIGRALTRDGQTWNERVNAGAPAFKPLEPDGRRMPIISLLNLKGGVGKTTIAANLAAALDAKGYRVLLVDLDLQGSLTGLFLNESEQEDRYAQNLLLSGFLNAAFQGQGASLLDYAVPILSSGKSSLVPTSDDLVYAETNLMVTWLLRANSRAVRDVRFLLRKELHNKKIANSFDIVLLDCPPLVNVSCVNALAASDYVLTPIMPSVQATARVPVLLRRIRAFRENVNPSIKVMGIINNRTTRSELTSEEENRLSLLKDQCLDVWGEAVPQFGTFIRQSVEVRRAEDQRTPLGEADLMRDAFRSLADEVESRLPMFCKVTPTEQRKEVLS